MTERTPERIRAHYEIEKKLAKQLRVATRDERRTLYSELYDRLFQLVPDHPQLTRKHSEAESQEYVQKLGSLIDRYIEPNQTFLEVGSGDCALCIELAKTAEHVYAVDVSTEITKRGLPENCELVISDGSSIPVPRASVDLAFSNQLMEHLHPDDAREQLTNIFDALAAGGRYICITPNKICGPHDVSQFFDAEATGFHLKEYTYRELVSLFEEAGFQHLHAIIRSRGFFVRVPHKVMMTVEVLGSLFPKKIRNRRPLRSLLREIILVATK